MWISQLRIKHNCVIGNKCKEFSVSTISMPFSIYIEKDVTYSPELHTLWGKEEDIKRFVEALKKDKRVKNLEVEGNKVFLVEVTENKIPVTVRARIGPEIIWTKPIYIDSRGEETWEVGAYKKQTISDFIKEVEKISESVIVDKIEKSKLDDLYYPAISPKLTSKQKQAILLAYEFGYYEWPKKVELSELAKKMGVSISTYREHLKRAESKFMPELIKKTK